MKSIKQVSIATVNCVDVEEGVKALRYSMRHIDFANAYLFTNEDVCIDDITVIKIEKLNSVDAYSNFMLKLHHYINPEYLLVVQDDGFATNPELWTDEFLEYDYIGAVWPVDESWIERQGAKKFMVGQWNRVGNGGFSLRSRRFLELSAQLGDSCGGIGEDVFLCVANGPFMKSKGVKFAPIELANRFSRENNLVNWQERVEHDPMSCFGFHGRNFSNHQQLIDLKNNF